MKAQKETMWVCNLLAHEDLGHFEEAHHWNIQAKFYNEKFPLVYECDKMREKERRDNATISFSTLVLQNSTMIFMLESLICCHFHILVGIFHSRTWLVYSNDGLPQKCPRSS